MRRPLFSTNGILAATLCLAVDLCLSPFVAPALAVTPADANAAFAALKNVHWDPDIKFFRKEERGPNGHSPENADFWFEAQIWDTVMDQYDRTGSADVKRQINDIYDGFVKVYPDWTTNMCNDDIMKLPIHDCGRSEFLPWMQANADAAWRNRRPDNILGNDWTAPTGSKIQSQTAASAVAVVVCFADVERAAKTSSDKLNRDK